jgi:hypothetical protein
MFGTRRSAICEPGRKASTPIRSTVTPPLILRVRVPFTGVPLSCASLIFSQTRRKSAFFFDRTTTPSSSSRFSRKTSTSSPICRLSGSLNSSRATAPSLLKPRSRITALSVTRSTRACTISPSSMFVRVSSYISSMASYSSAEYSSSSHRSARMFIARALSAISVVESERRSATATPPSSLSGVYCSVWSDMGILIS